MLMEDAQFSFTPEGWRRKEELRADLKEVAVSLLKNNPSAGPEVFSAFLEVSLDLLVAIVPDREHQLYLVRDLERLLREQVHPRSFEN